MPQDVKWILIFFGSIYAVIIGIHFYKVYSKWYFKTNFRSPLPSRLIREPIRLFHNACRSISWAKFMWDNHDFDDAYLIQVMNKKIEDMARFYSTKKYVAQVDESRKEILKDLLKARRYLKILINEDPIRKEYDEYYKKWGQMDMVWVDSDKPGYKEFSGFKYANAIMPEDVIRANEEFTALHKKEDEEMVRIQTEFFLLLDKKIKTWWD
jgi:hypothetical protein